MKPHIVNCYPCKGASPADDYVGMHMSNEECPACKNATIEKLQKALEQIYHLRPVACEWTDEQYYEKFAECEEIARTALQSIQGGDTHET